jgi:hypothetical protein
LETRQDEGRRHGDESALARVGAQVRWPSVMQNRARCTVITSPGLAEFDPRSASVSRDEPSNQMTPPTDDGAAKRPRRTG